MISQFTGQYRFLSNFYQSPFEWNRYQFPTVEHAFQASKAANIADFERVLAAKTPGLAKRIAHTIKLRPDWEEMKVMYMYSFLKLKFADPKLKSLLLATGDQDIVEGNNWGDLYWGKMGNKGKNMLGRLLMLVREELREE